jgi:hypothetical protein
MQPDDVSDSDEYEDEEEDEEEEEEEDDAVMQDAADLEDYEIADKCELSVSLMLCQYLKSSAWRAPYCTLCCYIHHVARVL